MPSDEPTATLSPDHTGNSDTQWTQPPAQAHPLIGIPRSLLTEDAALALREHEVGMPTLGARSYLLPGAEPSDLGVPGLMHAPRRRG